MSPPPLRRVVIVGNGIAGLTAADTLRSTGFDGELTIVGAERHAPYSRPALSKAALLDHGEMSSHVLPEPEHGATEIRGTAVTGLDADRRIVRLESGADLPYDGLVIASGSRARRLCAAGDEASGAETTLRGLDDAVGLRRRIATKPNVVVIGGGALGMEIASGCLASGCDVVLIARRAPLTAQLGPHLSDFFVAAARASGVDVRLSSRIEVRPDRGGAVVLLDDAEIEAELLVSAIGDVPNTEWLAGTGLLTGGELRVDTRGRVRPEVVAAGDVAAFPTARGVRRVPLWTSAIEQAKTAALGLLRGDAAAELDFQPYFWTEQFGVSLKACGELPVDGVPEVVAGALDEGHALLRWPHPDGTATAIAVNHRMPVPRLRAMTRHQAAAV